MTEITNPLDKIYQLLNDAENIATEADLAELVDAIRTLIDYVDSSDYDDGVTLFDHVCNM